MQVVVKRILRLLRVERGEYRLVALLLLHSFFIGVTVVFFETAAYSIFLTRYENGAGILPLVYMMASAITILVGVVYAWVERRVSFRRLLTLNLLTVLATLVIFRLLFQVTADPLPALLAVVGFDVLWVLQSLEFWGLAGQVFNVRQAKRLFGLIGSGEVVAMVVGGAILPLLLRLMSPVNLYFLACGGVVLSLLMMRYIIGQHTESKAEEADTAPERPGDDRTLRQMLRDRYVVFIFVLAGVTIFTLYFTDNAFYAMAESRFSNPDELAAFLGLFLAVAGVTQLFVRAVLSGWLLSHFGVMVGLLTLPVSLALSSAAAIIAREIIGDMALVFWLVVLVKLFDRSLRYSLNRASQLVLYQPLSPGERVRAQTAAESIVEPVAGIASGGVLLFLNQALHLDAIELLFGMMFIIALWLGVVVFLNRQYTGTLVQALNRRRVGGVNLTFHDSSSLAVLRRSLQSDRPGEVIYALNMLENAGHERLETFLKDLLSHPAPEVRRLVLAKIEKRESLELVPYIIERLPDEPVVEIQSYMLRVLCSLDIVEAVIRYLEHPNRRLQFGAMVGLLKSRDSSVIQKAQQQLLALAGSSQAEDRKFAAEIIGEANSPAVHTDEMLPVLLNDDSPDVRREAMIAAGKVKHAELYPLVVNNLETVANGLTAAMQTLTHAGEQVVPLLIEAFHKPDQLRHVMIRIIRIMSKIGGEKVIAWLRSQVGFPDEFVRYYVLEALLACGYQATPADYSEIEYNIVSETREVTWNLAALIELEVEPRAILMRRALEQEIELTRKRILMLLALRYDPRTMKSVQANYAHPSKEKRAYALEILDTTLSKDLKTIVMPLLEQSSPQKQLKTMAALYPQKTMEALARVRSIVLGEYREIHPWTKACAFYTLAELGDKQSSPDVAAVLFGTKDLIVRETALWTLYRLNPVLYNIYNRSIQDIQQTGGKSALAKSTIVTASSIEKEIRGQGKMLLLVEKVIILRTAGIFADMAEDYLAELAMVLQEVELKPGTTFIKKGEPGNCLYIIASGKVRVHDGEREIAVLGEREVVGELALLDSEPRNADVTAIEPVMLLKLDQDAFFELLANSPEVVRGVMRVLTRRLRQAIAAAR